MLALGLGPTVAPVAAFFLILLVAFLPPVLVAVRLRNAERHRPEPWRAVVSAFVWGAIGAVFLAILVEALLEPTFRGMDPWFGVVPLATAVLAPLAEEPAKMLGLFFIHDADPEPEDGIIYGGAAGLGFAATENVLFIGVAFVLEGQDVAIITAIYRGLVTVALHGAASALAGYGLWRARYVGRDGGVLGWLFLAMLVHGIYNGLVSAAPIGAALAAGIAGIVLYVLVRRRAMRLDAAGAAP